MALGAWVNKYNCVCCIQFPDFIKDESLVPQGQAKSLDSLSDRAHFTNLEN